MNNARILFYNNARTPRPNSITALITRGLGYCCEWFFWERYIAVSSDLIAARLGCAARTVNRHRQAQAEGEFICQQCRGCLKSKLNSRGSDSAVSSGEMK